MLGLPATPSAIGYAFLALGLVAGLLFAAWSWRRVDGAASKAAAVGAAATVAAAPFLAWRVVEDLRYVRALDPYDRSVAGPVQAYLAPYLLDPVARRIPRRDTYATVVGSRVPWEAARLAFPALAHQALFPRVSAPPREADWIVAWGADPARAAPVEDVTVARPAFAQNPPVVLARVRR